MSDTSPDLVIHAKEPPLRDMVCLAGIITITIADLIAVGWFKVPADTVIEISGPMTGGLLAFLKGS